MKYAPAVAEVIEKLSIQLRESVDHLVDLEIQAEELEAEIGTEKKAVQRVKLALEALTGNSIPVQIDLPGNPPAVEAKPKQEAAPVNALPPPAPVYHPPKGPPCSACGGEMYMGVSTIRGRQVQMLVCGDCKNEKPLAVIG